jgi:hypothetical protein
MKTSMRVMGTLFVLCLVMGVGACGGDEAWDEDAVSSRDHAISEGLVIFETPDTLVMSRQFKVEMPDCWSDGDCGTVDKTLADMMDSFWVTEITRWDWGKSSPEWRWFSTCLDGCCVTRIGTGCCDAGNTCTDERCTWANLCNAARNTAAWSSF